MLRRSEIAVLAGFALAASFCALRTPVFEAPDEPFHLDYVNFLLERRELPDQRERDRAVFREGHQPPLYYALAAAVVAPILGGEPLRAPIERNPEHALGGGSRRDVPYFAHAAGGPFPEARDRRAFAALRLLGVALGAANLAVVMRIARRFVGEEQAWVAGALVAALPQWLFICASVNNDNLANLAASGVVLATFRRLERPVDLRAALALGALLGAGLCVKKTSLALVPPVAAVFAWQLATAEGGGRVRVLRDGAVALAAMLALGGWWLVRNQVLYGDPLGSAMERETLHFIVNEQPITAPYFRGVFWSATLQSFVGLFGWMQIRLPGWAYAGWWSLLLLGVATAVVGAAREPGRRGPVALALGFAFSCLAAVVYYNTTFPEPQGRFLFPALGPVAALCAAGLVAIGARLGRAAPAFAAAVGVFCGAVLGVGWLRVAAFYSTV
jgi:4-amino-4-deoxy-L-arabinose transferase-like glycosyltransferase